MNPGSLPPRVAYLRSIAIVAIATGLCLAFRSYLATVDIAMLLLLSVVVVAGRFERGPAMLASVLSILVFDFLFVPPYHVFFVGDSSYYLTFVVMFAVALAMTRLTARIREQREIVADRERHTVALYALDRELASIPDAAALAETAVRHLVQVIDAKVRFLLRMDDSTEPIAIPTERPFDNPVAAAAARWTILHGVPAGWGTPIHAEADVWILPLSAGLEPIGIALIEPKNPDQMITVRQRELLTGLVERTATALERRILADRSDKSRVEVQAEKLRSALLSSLSHDMKSPLASIEGAASSLIEQPGLDRRVQRDLLDTVVEESQRMTRLVTNLLNIVRVETGTLAVQKSWQPIEEALGVALLRMDDRLAGHPVTVGLAPDLPLVAIDELLIEQVFLNLLENAIRHTPPGTAIDVGARAGDGLLTVEVADRGPGVAPGQEELVFHRFYRATHHDTGDGGAGSGLGLTICRGIITAHGGTIRISQRLGGGALVQFTLPLVGPRIEPIPLEPHS